MIYMSYLNNLEFGVEFKPFAREYVNTIKSCPNRRFDPRKKIWILPISDFLIAYQKFKSYQVKTNFSRSFLESNGITFPSLQKKKEELEKTLREAKPIDDYEFVTEPLPHQIVGYNMGRTKNKLLIGDEQGLGKSKMAIDIVASQKEKVKKCLIICGVNSTKYNWAAEVKKHSREQASVIDGRTLKIRLKQLEEWYEEEDVLFGIINIEFIRKKEVCQTIASYNIGAIIVDEIHKAKSHTSQQGRALRSLNAPIKIGLTGTPITRKASDAWNILTWLEAEHRSYRIFEAEYSVYGEFNQIVDTKNLASLNRILNTIMLRRKKEDVLNLPEKIHQTEFVIPSKEQLVKYEEYKKESESLSQDLKGLDEQIETESDDRKKQRLEQTREKVKQLYDVQILYMRRCLSGVDISISSDVKLKRIKEILRENIIPSNRKAIIFSQWKTVTQRYFEELSEFQPAYIDGDVIGKDRQKQIDAFQTDPNCKVIIGTIGAMGTGLTLNQASYVFFVDKTWTYADNVQAEDRAHRIGTKENVTIVSLVAKNTIDETVVEPKLQKNEDLFNQIVNGE